MRTTQYLLSTLKETPANTDIISHQLMLRSGMIRKQASGFYTWLPTGLRVLKKIEHIIREEMQKIGAMEILMPIIQSRDIWEKSGRLKQYGAELLSFIDRNERSFILGPTHEEIITILIRNEISSYKQLPINLFQIQTKCRDEMRPRFGVMRSREFIMKDAYSFHSSQESLQETYNEMSKTYSRIFTRMGLNFRIVEANTGTIGGNISHEFQVLAQSGEDEIVFSNASDYAANIEMAEAIEKTNSSTITTDIHKLLQFSRNNIENISELADKYHFDINKIVKTLIVKATHKSGYQLVALLIRGDHELNKVKAEKIDIVAKPLTFATEEEISSITNANSSALGPVGLNIPIIADRSVAVMKNFISGTNVENQYYKGINWLKDLPLPSVKDIRNVVAGDISPDGRGTLSIKKGIEIGHIFQIGTKYSEVMQAFVKSKEGNNKTIMMGCYGIGITRIVAAAIEQNHDDRGIIWSNELAPFQVAILPNNMQKQFRVKKFSEYLYKELSSQGVEVIIDDRKESLGVMFSDIELIGVPHIVVISERNFDLDKIEYISRRKGQKIMIKTSEIISFLIEKLRI